MKTKLGLILATVTGTLFAVSPVVATSNYSITGAGETPAAYAAAHPECNGIVRISTTREGAWASPAATPFPAYVPVLTILGVGNTYWVRCG